MSTSTYFRGVKLEDPSVTAFRHTLLGRATLIEPTAIGSVVAERRRAVAPPSPFRALRPGDVLVTLEPQPAPTTISSIPRVEHSPLRERQPIRLDALLAERSMAMRRARPATALPAAPRNPGIPPQLEDLATVFGRRAKAMRRAGLPR